MVLPQMGQVGDDADDRSVPGGAGLLAWKAEVGRVRRGSVGGLWVSLRPMRPRHCLVMVIVVVIALATAAAAQSFTPTQLVGHPHSDSPLT